MSAPKLSDSITLPCGVKVPNRIAKAAMTEQLADPLSNLPNTKLINLYRAWGEGGLGICLTGNVMVDKRYREAPRNVVLEKGTEKSPFFKWAEAITKSGCIAVMQISHPGRQCPLSVNRTPVAPSAIPIELQGPKMITSLITCVPRELTKADIEDVIQRFADTAKAAVDAGFHGVEIHSAHGYLLNQFLSSRANRRTDEYGGSLENRQRLLINVIQAVRAAVGPSKIVGVKINSADFQKGGFTEEESVQVLKAINTLKLDFIEISGGTYENMEAMKSQGPKRESTLKREAFFLDFCLLAKKVVTNSPLMLTGGFRTVAGMNQALSTNAVDIIGVARPTAVDPNFAKNLLTNPSYNAPSYDLQPPAFLGQSMARMSAPILENLWHQDQFRLIAEGKAPNLSVGTGRLLTLLGYPMLRSYVYDPFLNPVKSLIVVTCFFSLATWYVAKKFGF